jgi:hypothetical protein
MSLRQNVLRLLEAARAELIDAHDYHHDSQRVWFEYLLLAAEVPDAELINVITGTRSTVRDLSARSHQYLNRSLRQSTFQQFLSVFESFLFDLLQVWLTEFPGSLSRKTLDFKTVLDAGSREDVIAEVVKREIVEIAYQKPADWFAYLKTRTGVLVPSEEQIARLAEAKATRDVIIHNRGVANGVYLSKSGRLARHALGEPIELPHEYHQQSWVLLMEIVTAVAESILEKVGSE